MRNALMAASLLVLSACDAGGITYRCAQPQFSADDYRMAALDILGKFDDSPADQRQLDALLLKIAQTRPWAQKIQDPCMRYAALNWLDFFASQGREHLANGTSEDFDQTQVDRRMQQESMRKQDLIGRTALPPGKPD